MERRLVVLDPNLLEQSIFIILALFMLGGSLAMILNRQTIFSAFGFLLSQIGLAGMFALLDNRFLAIAQIMVSVGAIIVLSMLTILTLNAKEENLPKEPNKLGWIFFSTLLVAPFTYLLYYALTTIPEHFSKMETQTSKLIGNLLFSEWVLPFEIVSILLLTAMLGSIIIARKSLKGEQK